MTAENVWKCFLTYISFALFYTCIKIFYNCSFLAVHSSMCIFRLSVFFQLYVFFLDLAYIQYVYIFHVLNNEMLKCTRFFLLCNAMVSFFRCSFSYLHFTVYLCTFSYLHVLYLCNFSFLHLLYLYTFPIFMFCTCSMIHTSPCCGRWSIRSFARYIQ
jgi:hypothetical protein